MPTSRYIIKWQIYVIVLELGRAINRRPSTLRGGLEIRTSEVEVEPRAAKKKTNAALTEDSINRNILL